MDNQTNQQPVSGWSWGASMMSWMWGIGNHAYLPLLSFVPGLNLIWWIVCGICGHGWALKSGAFETVEEFNAVQRSWDRVGKVIFILTVVAIAIVVIFGGIFLSIFASMVSSIGY